MKPRMATLRRGGVLEGPDRGARRSAPLAALVLASLVLGLAPAATAQPSPNIYLRHCAAGPPFGSSANETAMTNVFGAVGEGWRSLCLETLSSSDLTELFGVVPADPDIDITPGTATFVFLDGSDRTATELAAFLAANRARIEAWVSEQGGKLFLNAGPTEGGNIDFGFRRAPVRPGCLTLIDAGPTGPITLVFDPSAGTPSLGGRAVEPTHPIFNGPFLPVGTVFSSDPNATFFSQGFIRDDSALDPSPLTTVIEQVGGAGGAALAEMTFGCGLVAFGSMTTHDLHLPQPEAANLRANIIAHVNGGLTNVQELIGGPPGIGSRWVFDNDGGTDNRLPTGGFCDGSPGLRADASLGYFQEPTLGDAFDGGLIIWINDRILVAPGTVRRGEPATYTAGPVMLADPAGVKATVEHMAAQGSATLRTLVRFDNPTPVPKSFTVDLVSNSGADLGFTVEATDAGDLALETTDRWIIVSDAGLPAPEGNVDVVVTHVVQGPGIPAGSQPTFADTTVFACGETGGVKVRFDLTVPAGAAQALLFFTQLSASAAAALSSVQAVFPGDPNNPVTDAELLSGLAPSEIVNWQNLGTPAFPLTVTKVGSGAGTVTSDVGGIACGGTCAASYPAGTAVVLTATAGSGSIFTGWSGGGCAGTGTCSLTVTRPTTVTAAFARLVTLSVVRDGSGTVTSAPAGISCGDVCDQTFLSGTVVTLAAAPAGDSIFAGFTGGGCSGTAPCTVTLADDTTVTATFAPVAIGGPFTLQVRAIGPGSGSVTSAPGGIACGFDCVELYAGGAVVSLTAAPAAGSVFLGFGGDPDCADGTVRLLGNRFCTAAFAPVAAETVSVVTSGAPVGGESQNPSVSADGRFVAFDSTAMGLVPAGPGSCTTGIRQVFVRDRVTGTTECVSVGPAGGPGNLPSARPALSADGMVVAFESTATDLVSGPPTGPCRAGGRQIFVRDRQAGTTT
jgi:hypothetical protein